MKAMAHVSLDSCKIPTPPDETDAAASLSGIRALMLAVLEDAIHSLSSSQSLVRAAAEHWIMSAEHRYAFSFVAICNTLDLEASAVRRSVMRLLDNKQTRGRLLRRSRPNVRHSVIQLRKPRPPSSRRTASAA